jgi:hypothetical protein
VGVFGAPFRRDYSVDSIAQGEGTRFLGSGPDSVGYAAHSGGDVDGDKLDDFVVCAYNTASIAGAPSAGNAYVLYGVRSASDAATAWPINAKIKTIAQDSTRGRIIDGAVALTSLGRSVAIVGDMNGDRFDDIAVSTEAWANFSGRAWIVWGKKRTETNTPLYVNALDASKFVQITGEVAWSLFGVVIAGGDINHDGFSDLLIGAPGYSSGISRGYIVWGHNGTWPATINATDIGVTVGGVKIDGKADSQSSRSIANAGDVNRDGKTDLIIGAYYANPSGRERAGRAYIVFGKGNGTWPTTINLDSLTAADGVIIDGAAAYDYLGCGVSGNVDVNGDNTADVIVGAHGAGPDATRYDAGITYVVFGSATLPSTIDTSGSTFFDGMKGFKLLGEKVFDWSAYSVSGTGDVNGDGIGDIIIGAPFWSLNGT